MTYMKSVSIHTDGACSGNPGPGGWAAIIVYGKKELELCGFEPDTTNNRMELTAAVKALEALKEPCRVTLYSDSTYLVSAFNEGWILNWSMHGWKRGKEPVKNSDLFRRLLELSALHVITWVHVKGHADNEYNNRCDALAVNCYKEHLVADRDKPYTGVLEETVTSKETYFRGRVFDIEKRQVTLPDGYRSEREIVLHPGGAAIVALDADNNVYLVRQYRSAAAQAMLEIPAGKLEKGEDPKAAAIRELKEETGLSAAPDKVELLTEVYVSPGYCTEKLYIYFTKCDAEAGDPHRDAGELLRCEKRPIAEVWIDAVSGRLNDAKTVIGICLAKERFFPDSVKSQC